MSTRNRELQVAVTLGGLLFAVVATGDGRFAEPASESDIREVYLSVGTDGQNLPDGSGDARAGKPLYEAHCASCHGLTGEGGIANQLAGGFGTLDSDQPVRTVGSYWPYATTVFNYVRRSMPFMAPMSLTNEDYYAITAYLLHLNGIVEEDVVIDRESLPRVEMPNRDGFVNAYPDRPPQYNLSE